MVKESQQRGGNWSKGEEWSPNGARTVPKCGCHAWRQPQTGAKERPERRGSQIEYLQGPLLAPRLHPRQDYAAQVLQRHRVLKNAVPLRLCVSRDAQALPAGLPAESAANAKWFTTVMVFMYVVIVYALRCLVKVCGRAELTPKKRLRTAEGIFVPRTLEGVAVAGLFTVHISSLLACTNGRHRPHCIVTSSSGFG